MLMKHCVKISETSLKGTDKRLPYKGNTQQKKNTAGSENNPKKGVEKSL